MANCNSNPQSPQNAAVAGVANSDGNVGRMFECRTCCRKFPSSQALGGHRASHNKAKSPNSDEFSEESNIPAKPKSHACKLCGDEFSSGQALGGHMRKHRDVLEGNNKGSDNDDDDDEKKKMMTISAALSSVTTESSFGNSDANNDCGKAKRKVIDDDDEEEEVVLEVPITKKLNNNSCKRVRSSEVDLELSLWWKKEQLEAYSDAVADQEQKNGDHDSSD